MRWFLLALAVFTASPAAAEGRLVIAPPSLEAWRTLFAHPEEWPQARARTGVFLFATTV